MRILVAEDDRSVARFLKKGLEAEHYAVDVVLDGQQAQEMTEAYEYDLLVLDLILPRLHGLQVLKQIRTR